MQPYQQRVVDEKNELYAKASALSTFISISAQFDTLDPKQQELLKEQNDVMWQYYEILVKRISLFNKESN